MTALIVSFPVLLNESVSYCGACTFLWTPPGWSQSMASRRDSLLASSSGEFEHSSPERGKMLAQETGKLAVAHFLVTTIMVVILEIWGKGKNKHFSYSYPSLFPSVG